MPLSKEEYLFIKKIYSKNAKELMDVLRNLFTAKYSKKRILKALAWGEKNKSIFVYMVSRYQKKYFNSKFREIDKFLMLKDLEKLWKKTEFPFT